MTVPTDARSCPSVGLGPQAGSTSTLAPLAPLAPFPPHTPFPALSPRAMDIVELVNEHEDRTATADRPFACTHEGCPKAFARKSDLVRHERIHNNERCVCLASSLDNTQSSRSRPCVRSPWKCEWQGCRRDFIQRSALVVHMRTQCVPHSRPLLASPLIA